jgi:imidazolonepropionase
MPKHRVDLLILESDQTITVPREIQGSDTLGIIDNGGVAVENGRTVQAAASEFLERKFSARRRIMADGQIILPGFVDPHTHLVFAGSREDEFESRVAGKEYMHSLRGGGGILETVRKTRYATFDELYSSGFERLTQTVMNGTTTVEVKTGYGLDLSAEQKMLLVINRLRESHRSNVVGTFLGAHAVPPEHPTSDDYTRFLLHDLLPMARKIGGASFCDVFCEEGVFTPEQSSTILRSAVKLGFKTKIHADEFSDSGGARVANHVKAISADHLIHSPAFELEKMSETGVVPVVLPASSHSLLMKDKAPAREMLSIGLPVALGTDFSPANWMLSQLTVAALAARELRMRSDEILRGITINAARALGLERSIGSITPRQRADLVLLNAPNHKWIGYAYGDGLVNKVLIRGDVVVEEGRPVF